MFNLDKFISDSVTKRPVSMFAADIEANKKTLSQEIKDKKVCVIGGAGSIGSSFIKAVLRFEPKSVVVVDLNENGLAELVRDVRSTEGLYVPDEFRCYTLNFADPIFERIFREEKGFDIVANFSAHKHVRSEKDKYSVQALIENIDIIKVVIKTVDRLLGRKEGEDMDLITFVTDRAGHDLRYAIDSTKLQKELGWEPSLQFEEGIEKTVKWYLENQEWLENVTSGDYQKYYENQYKNM